MGRDTLEIPPRSPGFLERFQGAAELVYISPNLQAIQSQRKIQSGGSLTTDKMISHLITRRPSPWLGISWSPSLAFATAQNPTTSGYGPHTGASLAAWLMAETMSL